MATSIAKWTKPNQDPRLSEFNGNNNSDYQAFENIDGTVDLYWSERLVTEFSDIDTFIGWSERDE